jgi:hypothetical protein
MLCPLKLRLNGAPGDVAGTSGIGGGGGECGEGEGDEQALHGRLRGSPERVWGWFGEACVYCAMGESGIEKKSEGEVRVWFENGRVGW